jgi:hypothetical protein
MAATITAPLWVNVAVVLVLLPALAIATQALIRRFFPTIRRRKHNSVAGYMLAVVGVIYAVTAGFIIANQWENYTNVRNDTHTEAFTLAGVAEASRVMGPAEQQAIVHDVIAYNQAVINWWPQPNHSPALTDDVEDQILDRLIRTVSDSTPTNDGQRAFVQQAIQDLMTVDAQNDRRLHLATETHLETPLFVLILVSSAVTITFCLLFGLENQWLHYVMVGAVAFAIGANLMLILLLDRPLSGLMPISPGPYQAVITDLQRHHPG